MALSVDSIDKIAARVVRNAKNIQGLSKLASRKSIMTMASPGMYQYPMVISNGIEVEYQMAIAKAFQLTFASSVATAYSLNPLMDKEITPQLSDFVQTFHQNNPSLLYGNIGGAATSLNIQANESAVAVESATVINEISQLDKALSYLDKDANTMEDCLVMESLNDMYKPYERTKHILKERIDLIKSSKATEGAIFDDDNGEGILSAVNRAAYGRPGSHNATGISTGGKQEITSKLVYKTTKDKDGNVVLAKDKDGNPIVEKKEVTKKSLPKKPPIISNFKNEVVRNNQMEAMEPTMVNVQIVAHGTDGSGQSSQSVHNLTLGVKVMPRIISSNLMIASMVEAAQDSHAIFRFLKWTKGEEKTLDFILGISASKKKALEKNAKNEVKFLEQGKKRKRLGGIGKFLNNEVLPTISIIITSYEASKIKEVCGVDLTKLSEAIKLMNRYYLLGFGIYNTEQNVLQVLFDCDSDWGYTTIGALKANVNKTNDVLNQNEVLRLLGRR